MIFAHSMSKFGKCAAFDQMCSAFWTFSVFENLSAIIFVISKSQHCRLRNITNKAYMKAINDGNNC